MVLAEDASRDGSGKISAINLAVRGRVPLGTDGLAILCVIVAFAFEASEAGELVMSLQIVDANGQPVGDPMEDSGVGSAKGSFSMLKKIRAPLPLGAYEIRLYLNRAADAHATCAFVVE
jgi:hypothetical protein